MAMNPTNGMAAGQPGTGNPFAGRSGQVPAAQDVQGRQAPREEQAAQPIGPKQLSEATQVLLKYKSGKAALDRRIVENEHWYRLHRDTEDGNFADSGWMFNSLANKHADAMDNYPEPNVLPRAQDDADTAKELSSILPVALDQNDYEQVYSDAWWYKLKHGTAVKGVFWNGAKDGGLGDIDPVLGARHYRHTGEPERVPCGAGGQRGDFGAVAVCQKPPRAGADGAAIPV